MNSRHKAAAAEGRRIDKAFYEANPERDYHARPSLQFECADWDENQHLVERVVISRRSGSAMASFPVEGDPKGIPDDERFLELLWNHSLTISPDDGRPVFLITPKAHAALLDMAGIKLAGLRN